VGLPYSGKVARIPGADPREIFSRPRSTSSGQALRDWVLLSNPTQDWRPGLASWANFWRPFGTQCRSTRCRRPASIAEERTMQRQKPMIQICATWVSAFAPSSGDIRAWKRKTSNKVLQHMYPNITPRASAATTAQNTVNIPTSFPIMALQIWSFGSSPGASCAHSRNVSVSL
jgi:hypothetical protein